MVDNLTLIHMNGRMYDPILGRFLSADPIVQTLNVSQALNRYSYVWNNPATLIDPSGFTNETPCKEGMSGIDCDTLLAMDPHYNDYPRQIIGTDLEGIEALLRSNQEHPPIVSPSGARGGSGGANESGPDLNGLVAQEIAIFARPPFALDPIMRPLPEGVVQAMKPQPQQPSPIPEILRPIKPKPLTPAEALEKCGSQPDELKESVEQPESFRVGPKNFEDTGWGLLYRILKPWGDPSHYHQNPPGSTVPIKPTPPPPSEAVCAICHA
jgi:RHS repeat-associated protein